MRAACCGLLWAALLAAGPLRAQQPTFEDEKPWEEEAAALPAYPRDEALVRIDTGPLSRHQVWVDPDSLTVGGDGVVRFTLVIKTEGGATNVSHEGIRCKTRERKSYGIGRADRTWVPARNTHWLSFHRKFAPDPHVVLAREYFCPQWSTISDAREGRDALLAGGNPRAGK